MIAPGAGHPVPAEALDCNWPQSYVVDPQVESAWLEVYRNPEQHWDL